MITQCSMLQGDEFLQAQTAVDYLQDTFPGWGWSAMVDGGILYLKNTTLSEQWGMQLRIMEVDKLRLIRAGGELLERFNMPYNFKEAALQLAAKDFTGAFMSEKWTADRRYFNKSDRRWKA